MTYSFLLSLIATDSDHADNVLARLSTDYSVVVVPYSVKS